MKTLRIFAAALFVLFLAPSVVRAQVPLVRDGVSEYEIVLDEGAGAVATLAAQELQEFVAQSCGVQLPIVDRPTAGRGHVFVGANPTSSAAGITAEGLAPEGFRLKTVGRDLHIIGSDAGGNPTRLNRNVGTRTGTLSGVYELLERFFGVMFCWHDELGTVVPPHTTVVIPEIDITSAPQWAYRALPYSPEGKTYELFGRRLRLGNSHSVVHAHAWFQLLPISEFAADHPEYYALVNGRRVTSHYMQHHGGQVCTSNPEVVQRFAESIIRYFDNFPDRNMASISPNDGGGFCQCDNCRALDAGGVDENDNPILTDRLLHFYNDVARRVAEVHPDRYIGAYIYSFYQTPPQRETPHPSLYLVHATNSAHMQGLGWPEERQWELDWARHTTNLAKYDIYYFGSLTLHLMAPVTTHLIEKMQAGYEAGFRGGYLYISQSYEQLGAGHYLLARLMWDKNADARAIEQQYYNALYGAAGPDVKQYYDLLEQRLRTVYLEGVDVDDPGIACWTNPRTRASSGMTLAAYWPVLEQAEALMMQARARELSDLEAQRLERLIDHHELLVSTVRGMVAAGRLTRQAVFVPDDVAMLREAVGQREAAKVRIREYAPTLAEYLERADLAETAPVTPHGAFFQLTQAEKPLQVMARQVDAPPISAAGGNDRLWNEVPAHYFLLTRSAVPPGLGVKGQVAYDAENLYVRVAVREDDGSRILHRHTGRDDTALFGDDAVELFIRPPGTDAYYHIALGAGGALYDAAHPQGTPESADRGWNADITSAVHLGPHGWIGELVVPFAALGATPGDGTWHINIHATRRGGVSNSEYTALSPTFGGYHVPERFAPVVFADDFPGPRLRYGTFEDVPEDFLRALRGQESDGARIHLVEDRAYAGTQALHVTVPEGGLASVTFSAQVKPQTGYRATFCHFNDVTALRPGITANAPHTRVIFRDEANNAVTDTREYSWEGAPALENPRRWRVTPHVFTTPEGTSQITFTIFFHHPGEYWLDEVRLEEL